ncbi:MULTISPECIES: MOFRL family protein [unclassified Azospirillum]|uniref:MOFRL family protein n=1 Tax=unclassified Azospirillum TaxID=2630922 RepID=UPI000B681D8D|nr:MULTISPECIES: MOFRL family protein [unclassified Azospirillum]SNS30405.1 MOFRL family protein [Azospirillum sp. RU38E]SNS48847.1 MOFRL family protein [Azospirillum sp. RU37A]
MTQTPPDLLRQLYQTALAASADRQPHPSRDRSAAALSAATAMASDLGLETIQLETVPDAGIPALVRPHADLARATPPGTVIFSSANPHGLRGQDNLSRNLSYLLGLGLALDGARDIWALAADTDGLDSGGTAAGALLHPDSLSRALALGLEPGGLLEQGQAPLFFASLGDLLPPAPAEARIRDFRAILVL